MPHHPWLTAAFDRLDVPDETRALITLHHSEAHRYYHTLRHIDLMLRHIPTSHAFAREMMAATLFHDIIYDPTRFDNEEMSLAMFQSAADAFAPPELLDRLLVSAMILATKNHHFRDEGTQKDEAINLLLKADLSILWHPDPEVYAWYAAGVRKEYGFVPEAQFREARATILTGLRDDLLRSEHLTSAEGKILTRNVAWELRSLGLGASFDAPSL
jgi:predicted metal-dependent HD superfamily phosphohydrolase